MEIILEGAAASTADWTVSSPPVPIATNPLILSVWDMILIMDVWFRGWLGIAINPVSAV